MHVHMFSAPSSRFRNLTLNDRFTSSGVPSVDWCIDWHLVTVDILSSTSDGRIDTGMRFHTACRSDHELVVLASPSWKQEVDQDQQLASYYHPDKKQRWDHYMAGPSSKLAGVVEDNGWPSSARLRITLYPRCTNIGAGEGDILCHLLESKCSRDGYTETRVISPRFDLF